jgi:hypothetical protein
MNQFVRGAVSIAFCAVFAVWGTVFIFSGAKTAAATAVGIQAELRSSATILPALTAGMEAPTAPAGAVVIGAQAWVCDGALGFAPIVNVEPGVADSLLAIGAGGIHLPISPTNVPATGGQMAYANSVDWAQFSSPAMTSVARLV